MKALNTNSLKAVLPIGIGLLMCLLIQCKPDEKVNAIQPENKVTDLNFIELFSEETGVKFINRIFENDELNYFKYEYLYNGGGVSIADFNNDGKEDIFFTCNMGKNRLYANQGNMKFTDVSSNSGISSTRDWCTGTTITDINNDGLVDIYVSRSGWFDDAEVRRNLLYVNQGNFQFKESGRAYGIDDAGLTTQSCFFDMDQDGDLDLYVMNHPRVFNESLTSFKKKRAAYDEFQSDQLYENVNGLFQNITTEAGIANYGHGLGLFIGDLNGDYLPDIYVSNDYQQHDFVYINQGNKKFTDESDRRLKHHSKFSMGVDVGDINADGLPDVVAVEMMPADNFRQKTNMASMNPELYQIFLDNGLGEQEMHNSLQLNTSDGYFVDVAYHANIAQTDWSWAPLIQDYNSDGKADMFISNGYRRDVLNKDFKNRVKSEVKKKNFLFSDIKDLYEKTKSKNYFYQQGSNGQYEAKLNELSVFNTNGAAYGDLDNDGDLDLVCNNMEDEAVIYLNELEKHISNNYIFKFSGNDQNRLGVGANVHFVEKDGSRLMFSNQPVRGFQSSVSPILHVNLPPDFVIIEVYVVWPDLTRQEIEPVLGLNHIKYTKSESILPKHESNQVSIVSLPYEDKSIQHDDYAIQVLLPYKISEVGPKAASIKFGEEPLYIIADQSKVGLSFLSFQNNEWLTKDIAMTGLPDYPLFSGISTEDFDGDGLEDVYLSRGNYRDVGHKSHSDMILYQRAGTFNTEQIDITHTVSPVSGDFDGDDDIDVFVGGGVKEGRFPLSYPSYMLWNTPNGFQKQVLIKEDEGLIQSTVASDITGDGVKDLLVCGEWMPLHVYSWDGSDMELVSDNILNDNEHGWYRNVTVADIDGDGIAEILLGNLGDNTKMKAEKDKPFSLYSGDYDKDGSQDIVLAFEEGDKVFPVRGKQCSSEQIPEISEKFKQYEQFAVADVEGIYGKEEISNGIHFFVTRLESGYYKKNGKKYGWHAFPAAFQYSLINDYCVTADDQCPIVYFHGNQKFEVETGSLDAFSFSSYKPCTKTTTQRYNWGLTGSCSQILNLREGLVYLMKGDQAKMFHVKQ